MKYRLNAEAVRKILAKKKISQNALALRLCTTSGFMSQLMNGKRSISPIMAANIATVLKVADFQKVLRSVRS